MKFDSITFNSLNEAAEQDKENTPFFEKLITKKQLAEHTGYSISYIDKLMKKGLPHIKIGRTVRYQFSAVVTWLKKRSLS